MELKKTYGLSGTDIYSGYIDADYNPIWRGKTKIDLIEEMKKSDATISAISDAIKAPLLAVNWYTEAGSKDEKDHEINEFVSKVLFWSSIDFKSFLEEALLFVDYGYYPFEKIFTVRDGLIVWKSFAPRVPSSLEHWGIGSTLWKDGKPTGITQTLNFTDEARAEEMNGVTASIPWNKLILFTHRQTGDNFEGESIFRRCYSHWSIKQKLYKIGAVSAERYGVGTPFFKLKMGTREDIVEKYETLAKQLRSNERAGLVITEEVIDWGIKTLDGGQSVSQMIDEMVKHHDKKMYDAVLAGFLNLSSGQGGSNALSQDQSSFFIQSVHYIAKKFCAVMDKHIQELVIMNFGPQEYYPTLCYSELSEKNVKEMVDGMAVAVGAGMLQWGDLDEQRIREMYDLAEREDVKSIEPLVTVDAEAEAEEGEDAEAQAIEDKTEPEEEKEIAESNEAKTKLSALPKVPAYERAFTKAISDFENYLESEYANFDRMANEAEAKYKEVMLKSLEKAETERKDGIVVISSTPANARLWRETTKEIDAITKRLEKKWVNSPMQKRMFTQSQKMALGAFDIFSMSLADIDPVKLEGMIRGYKSNIMAVLGNDPRRVKEQMDIILTTGAQKEVAKKAIEDMQIFNKNTLKLSVQAHPRAAFNSMVYDEAEKGGFTFFKVLVPSSRLKDVSPSGMTMGILYSVMTVAAINAYANKETDGKNPSAVQGLGLHHNSFEYYMPVPSEDLAEQEELGSYQKKELEGKLAGAAA